MNRKTDIAKSVEIAGVKAAYDAEIKELLLISRSWHGS